MKLQAQLNFEFKPKRPSSSEFTLAICLFCLRGSGVGGVTDLEVEAKVLQLNPKPWVLPPPSNSLYWGSYEGLYISML